MSSWLKEKLDYLFAKEEQDLSPSKPDNINTDHLATNSKVSSPPIKNQKPVTTLLNNQEFRRDIEKALRSRNLRSKVNNVTQDKVHSGNVPDVRAKEGIQR